MSTIETTEQILNRMYSGWTDDEVHQQMETLREADATISTPFALVWREYARRTYGPRGAACTRCGSDNHTAVNHPG